MEFRNFIFFRKRVERSFDVMKRKNKSKSELTPQEKAEKYLEEQKMPTEKGDMLSMILSAWMIILPIALLALLVIVGLPLLLIWLL